MEKPTVEEIVKLATDIVSNPKDAKNHEKWKNAIFPASTEILVEVTARLTSDETHTPANIKALRESVISEIERKNAEKIIQTMQHLDKSANKLTTVTIILAIIGLILAAIQVLKEFNAFQYFESLLKT